MDKLSFEELNITKFSLSQLEIFERSEVKCSVLIPLVPAKTGKLLGIIVLLWC